jgi:methyl-accepting chemotaxis protein
MKALSRLRIRARLLAGFFAVLALTAVIGVVGWSQLRATADTYDTVVQNDARLTKDALEMEIALLSQVVGVRGYIITRDETYLAPYTDGLASFREELDSAKAKDLNPEERAVLTSMERKYAALTPIYEREIALVKQGKIDEAVALAEAEGKPAKDAVVADITALIGQAEEVMYSNAASANDTSSFAGTLMLALLLGALALGAAVAILIARSITGPLGRLNARLTEIADGDGDLTARVDATSTDELGDLGRVFNRFVGQIQDLVRQAGEQSRALSEMAQEMARSSEQSGRAVAEIAGTVDSVAKGSSEQAESVQSVAEIVAEMSRGVTQVSSSGQEAAQRASEADEQAGVGAERVTQAQEAMRRISRSSQGVFDVISQLDQRSQAIGEIVDTITQIAGQTNLLALNAAIEAARAGEQGRGFAVVADEVRKLAEESQEAAGSIGEILGQIQSEAKRAVQAMTEGRTEVEEGTRVVEAAGEAFAAIRAQVQAVAAGISEAAAGAQQLEAGAGEVQDRIAGVAAVSEENAAAAEQVAAATEETTASVEEVVATTQSLSGSAAQLRQMVERFRV